MLIVASGAADSSKVKAGRRRSVRVGTSGDSVRRIAIASGLIVVVLAAAIGVTIWRYGDALTQSGNALRDRTVASHVQDADTAFWQEREAMNEHLAVPSSTGFKEIDGDGAAFSRAMHQLDHGTATQRVDAAQAIDGNEKLVAIFSANVNDPRSQLASTIGRLSGAEPPVTNPLNRLQRDLVAQIAADQRTASAAKGQALTAALVGGVLAILIGIGFAFYARRLVARVAERESRLSALVGQTRSSMRVLSEVAGELRSAASDSEAAAAEQSSAVAETSATIEELSVTATSIADNARAVAVAAEQTGDTMRDMQEKVEAIAQRSLSLGERGQQIGDIVALINEIANQTNLLALNAAIEAARAGEAGRGFAVVAAEVRKLAERSMQSSDSIRDLITSVQDETNATIMATEQGNRQAREVGELMASTATMLEESILATQQQKSAADQVTAAIVEIRTTAEHLAAEQVQRAATSQRVEELVRELESVLDDDAASIAAPLAHANGSR
jgi:methyl-accepting chemotaxis protein